MRDDNQPPTPRHTLVLRPLQRGDEAELRRIHETAEVARWWDRPEDDFPWDEPESTRFTIVVDGAIAGLIQFWEEREPRYLHAGIDVFLDPALHGRGLGSEAVARIARHLFDERGHHVVIIDPAAHNRAAIRAYEKVGFRAVGLMRHHEREIDGDGWHDCLMMDLLAHELRGA
jgi:aminoglycoside 6'-N-acetyltransferase